MEEKPFLVQFGKVGKALIQKMANLFQVYGENSSLECIALKACAASTETLKDHVTCLQRRLESWKKGEIEVLVVEGQCIQSHLPSTNTRMNPEAVSRALATLQMLPKPYLL